MMRHCCENGASCHHKNPSDQKGKTTRFRVALAGNPNTGKSTLFNALTGLRQHTGNWPGKTVLRAEGTYSFKDVTYTVIDLPGTYSLYSNSADEEVARDYIVFEQPDVTVVVLDATSLERNLNLALQVLEMSERVVVCLNLMDEANRKGIRIDDRKLSSKLGVPVVKTAARDGKGLTELKETVEGVARGHIQTRPFRIRYSDEMEEKIKTIEADIRTIFGNDLPSRWIALRLLDGDPSLTEALKKRIGKEESTDGAIAQPPYPAEA
ncbi:ferrous iron transport protein B [Melghirimyces profundicolus]|uniref:Ferrous iron transport protein B n=1 Tax=Melghirimyces profundicolus TaxID=1242148 RepID=A0A2T6BGZ4_9BACL|nr:FeoB small GTPase domain-containing protein [Melghirimyces profundicolus]PTX55329.1 ferrous iron transport protein B [Melghirimyces profundicolus]